MFIQYYISYYAMDNDTTGFCILDNTGWHGLFLSPSECQWMVPGTIDPNA